MPGGSFQLIRGSQFLLDFNVDAYKAWLDKFWSYQAVKYDFTADLTGTGHRSEDVLKTQSFYYVRHIDAGIRGVSTYVRNVLMS